MSNLEKKYGMIQVRKVTGTNINANLDPFTLACLERCREKLQCGEKRLSNNVLIRTAIRHYHEHISSLGNSELVLETKTAKDAARG